MKMEKIVDKMVEAFRKANNGIVPMESFSNETSCGIAITIDGVGYSFKVVRDDAYDEEVEVK